MSDTDRPQEQNSTPQPIPEDSLMADELSPSVLGKFDLEGQPHEKEIDLNELFPDTETNLNDLFPDEKVKHLLKSITKNKKDMKAIKERLTNENQTSSNDGEGQLLEKGSFTSNKSKNKKTD